MLEYIGKYASCHVMIDEVVIVSGIHHEKMQRRVTKKHAKWLNQSFVGLV